MGYARTAGTMGQAGPLGTEYHATGLGPSPQDIAAQKNADTRAAAASGGRLSVVTIEPRPGSRLQPTTILVPASQAAPSRPTPAPDVVPVHTETPGGQTHEVSTSNSRFAGNATGKPTQAKPSTSTSNTSSPSSSTPATPSSSSASVIAPVAQVDSGGGSVASQISTDKATTTPPPTASHAGALGILAAVIGLLGFMRH